RLIAEKGSAGFYSGTVAEQIVDAVGTGGLPGSLALEDFDAYRPQRLDAVCRDYRDYRICGMGPPSSGGITTLGILGLLERFDLDDYEPNDPQAIHYLAEASRLAFADRNRYIADDRYVPVPTTGLLDAEYIAERGDRIHRVCSMGVAKPGVPFGAVTLAAPVPQIDPSGTTPLSVVDGDGN